MKPRSIPAAALLFLFAGCQTWGPTWSEITGTRYNRTIADRWQAQIVSVGSNGVSQTPYKVAPGTYSIGVESPRHDGFAGTVQEMTLNVEPCKRYYINAQFSGPIGPNWSPVVDYVESIAGCKVGG
jgi:hypothetical protein